MGDHPTISTESGPGSSAVPSHPALTRRRLLGGAGIRRVSFLMPGKPVPQSHYEDPQQLID